MHSKFLYLYNIYVRHDIKIVLRRGLDHRSRISQLCLLANYSQRLFTANSTDNRLREVIINFSINSSDTVASRPIYWVPKYKFPGEESACCHQWDTTWHRNKTWKMLDNITITVRADQMQTFNKKHQYPWLESSLPRHTARVLRIRSRHFYFLSSFW